MRFFAKSSGGLLRFYRFCFYELRRSTRVVCSHAVKLKLSEGWSTNAQLENILPLASASLVFMPFREWTQTLSGSTPYRRANVN